MKTRFDGLDVKCQCSYLDSTLKDCKLINIYDAPNNNNNTFLFKFQNDNNNNNNNNNNNKTILLIESGVRFHVTSTNLMTSTNPNPSQFARKLRKHLRNLRLEGMRQLGQLDRVIDLRFGSGVNACHLIVEFYASGNMILTDSKYEILALLRVHDYQADNAGHSSPSDSSKIRVRVGAVYPVTFATTLTAAAAAEDGIISNMDPAQVLNWMRIEVEEYKQKALMAQMDQQLQVKKKKKKKKIDKLTLKNLLLKPSGGVYYMGPSLIEHCIKECGLDPSENMEEVVEHWREDNVEPLIKALSKTGVAVIDDLENSGQNQGYILYKQKPCSEEKVFDEFQPHLLHQHQDLPVISFSSFNEAIDEFYSRLDEQKQTLRSEAAETAAKDRLEKVRLDQERRMEGLIAEQEILRRKATLVQMYAEDVDKALLVINSALDSGMSWNDLDELVEYEKNVNENPIALLIARLNLDDDSIILNLQDHDEDKYVEVKVSRALTGYGNASAMFDRYRELKEKSEKTAEASMKALKAAEATAQKQLQEARGKKLMTLKSVRRQNWFEKFRWFITSDNYLVIAGRDAQQNEILVKRYLRVGDAYLHADIHGASSCILRAKRRRLPNGSTKLVPLSDQALKEAGNFTICHSAAWKAKQVTSAWWVESHQVSKTAPTGEYLTTGSFMIRGKKNFLPPTPLEMGLALLFRLGDDESVARHENERKDYALLEPILDEEETTHEEDEGSKEDDDNAKVAFPVKESQPVIVTSKNNQLNVEELEDDIIIDGDENEEISSVISSKDGRDIVNEMVSIERDGEDLRLEKEIGKETDNNENGKGRKGLSIKERKLIKKYGSLENAKQAVKERAEMEAKNSLTKSKKKVQAQVADKSKEMNKRGKRGKQKKRIVKYSDQDEADKELAEIILHGKKQKDGKKKGSGSKIIPPKSTTQIEAEVEAASLLIKNANNIASKLTQEVRKLLISSIANDNGSEGIDSDDFNWAIFDADILEELHSLDDDEAKTAAAGRLLELSQNSNKKIDNLAASLSGIIRTIRKYGHRGLLFDDEASMVTRQTEKIADWEEIINEGHIGEEDESAQVDDSTELNKLTGKPIPDDNILYAMPVCGPYIALTQYKYRVKLVPGPLKRGKAAKQCLEMFAALNKDDPSSSAKRENEFTRAISDADWNQALCGDVKISAPGVGKVVKQQKNKNKGGKKKTG